MSIVTTIGFVSKCSLLPDYKAYCAFVTNTAAKSMTHTLTIHRKYIWLNS